MFQHTAEFFNLDVTVKGDQIPLNPVLSSSFRALVSAMSQ